METPSSLRGRTQWTQQRLAAQLGIHQVDVSDIELGKRDLGEQLAAKWAHLINVSGTRLVGAAKHVQRINQAITDSEGLANLALKNSDLAGVDGVAGHMQRLAADSKVPAVLRDRAFKVAERLAGAVPKLSDADTVTMTLGSGVTGEFTVQPDTSLDPDRDATGLQVAHDGDGNFYVADSQTGEAFGPMFGSLVSQQGTPAGSKATKAKSTRGYRDGFGHRRGRNN